MQEYSIFNERLQKGLNTFLTNPRITWESDALKYVNGFADEELRRLVDLKDRKRSGAFFTNSELAKKVILNSGVLIEPNSIIYDPACGAGNLLIAISEVLKDGYWGSDKQYELLGTDIHEEFVKACILRLNIHALLSKNCGSHGDVTFKITLANSLEANDFYKSATHVFTNPPFNLVSSNTEIKWSNGKVSAAALFLDKIIKHIKPNTVILAILPEVLRSGSRYLKWRQMIQEYCEIKKIQLLGQFDRYADIDVFAITLVKRNVVKLGDADYLWKKSLMSTSQKVSDLFFVNVGSVVDNRDVREGPAKTFITSKGLKGWVEINSWPLTRKHKGKVFKSPFIVIKRTSRMGDSHRAIATIINLSDDVFVDNHLIVLKPKSGKLDDCKDLLVRLKTDEMDIWLNNEIRCRHLTVKIVSEMPI